MKTYTVYKGHIALCNKSSRLEISSATWSPSWTWGALGSLSLWQSEVWSLEADFLGPPGNTALLDGLGNVVLWCCAKDKYTVDLDPSAGDVGFGFVSTPCYLFSAKWAAEVCAGVCNQHRKLGDQSRVPTLTASFHSNMLVTVFIWVPSTFFCITVWSKPFATCSF